MRPSSDGADNLGVTEKRAQLDTVRRLRCIDWLKLVASLFVPFLLGVATIVLSMQQSELSQRNRIADLDIAIRKSEDDARLAMARAEEDMIIAYKRDIWGLIRDELNNDENSKFNYYRSQTTRALTLSTLRRLSNPYHKREIIHFLYDMQVLAPS